jgi:hypothetical protein
MADLSLFSNEQIAALLSALPDPAFILTRSGRYAAIFGGTDSRYYHDGSSLVGKYISDVLNDEKPPGSWPRSISRWPRAACTWPSTRWPPMTSRA